VRYDKSRAFQFLLFTVLSYGALSPFSDQHVIAATWQLTWADNSSNETGFRIERKTGAAGMFSVITTTGPDVTSYNDSTLSDSTMYCYRVNAFNGAGSSPYTPEVCGTTPAPPPTTYSLTVSAQGSGTVTSSPSGVNCGTTCVAGFTSGAVITLQALAATGYTFAGWGGDADCSDGSLTMNANKTCTATFMVKGNKLHIVLKGKGKGRVTGSPGFIDCVTDCSAIFTAPTRVVLRAIPALGSAFTGWSGDQGCSNGVVATITSISCIANFEQRPSSIGIFNTTNSRVALKEQYCQRK
jgi:uncharacterized repeat protein (TIGR02543 family)